MNDREAGTTNATLQERLAFANQLADMTGPRLVGWFGNAAASTKRDGSVVTEADLDVDRFIQDAIHARYPDHDVLSEEISLTYQGSRYTWVVDPLDGTTNFADGLPIWGTSMALLADGLPVVALLDFPLLRQRYTAYRSGGAWLNGRRLQVAPTAKLHSNQIIVMDSRASQHVEICLPPKIRVLGSAAYELAAVAAGVAVGCLETRCKVWDVAAAWLIAEEAGAAIATWLNGNRLFPLQPGRSYGDLDYPTLCATDLALWQTIKVATRLRPGSQRLLRRLKAQGWVFDQHEPVSVKSLSENLH